MAPDFVREFQESTLSQPAPPGLLTVVQESLKVPARVWRAVCKCYLEDDYSRELDRIAVPTLIVWGDKDTFCPRATQESLRRAIAVSQLIIYQGAGHALHWEEPARFAADLVAFTGTLRDHQPGAIVARRPARCSCHPSDSALSSHGPPPCGEQVGVVPSGA